MKADDLCSVSSIYEGEFSNSLNNLDLTISVQTLSQIEDLPWTSRKLPYSQQNISLCKKKVIIQGQSMPMTSTKIFSYIKSSKTFISNARCRVHENTKHSAPPPLSNINENCKANIPDIYHPTLTKLVQDSSDSNNSPGRARLITTLVIALFENAHKNKYAWSD